MKSINVLVMALVFAFHASAADVLTEKLQRGLFEEEANHNLDAAIKEYQSVVAQSDEQRKVTATALFRLGECYRKLGRTNEANAQYQRILRDFSEQEQLVKLSRELLPRSSAPLASIDTVTDPVALNLLREEIRVVEQSVQARERLLVAGRVNSSEVLDAKKEVLRLKRRLPENAAPSQQRALLEEQIDIVKQHLSDIEKRAADRRPPGEQLSIQRELLSLQRELAMVGDVAKSFANSETAATDEEEKEVRRIRAMIKDSPDLINARGGIGGAETPLHRATAASQLVVARFLLSNNADVNAKNAGGDTPLHLAAVRGHKSMVELLLDNRADVNAMSPNGGSPLHLAAQSGFRAVADVLLARQADVNAKTSYGRTALHNAVTAGHKAVSELLLEKGADVNAATSDGWTPLHLAADGMHKPVVELLLSRGARVNAKQSNGGTPLSLSVGRKSIPVAETLLANKADPNIADSGSVTPLSIAVKDKSLELVTLLLAHGADPNIGDRHKITPLHWASIYGEAAIAEALLKNKASPDPKIAWDARETAPTYRTPQNNFVGLPNGPTPLWFAIVNRHRRVVELLLSSGTPINAQIAATLGGNTSYQRPLELAVSNNDREMVELLLQRKADPNFFSAGEKLTPLMKAAGNRSRDNVDLLLAHGAEVNVLSEGGYTPLSIAETTWGNFAPSPQIAELLRARGAIADLQRSSSLTLARYTARHSIFEKDTNGFNRFTLFETIAMHYATAQEQNRLRFPDFSRVKVKRLKSPSEELSFDLETAFKFSDCSKDQWLEWGDLVEIPEQDHKVNENWLSLPQEVTAALNKCLDRKVQVIVKGQTNIATLSFGLVTPQPYVGGVPGAFLPPAPAPRAIRFEPSAAPGASPVSEPEIKLGQFRLNDVVRSANVIRSSSDLGRVTVKRADPITHEKREMVFDLTKVIKRNDLWLRDGDVIEIPDKQ
jgi:ankyrin repeat protein